MQVCASDLAKCAHLITRRSVEAEPSLVRSKRAANEAELLETALLTEGTYEATVTAVTDTR